jgi:hypothetical protein
MTELIRVYLNYRKNRGAIKLLDKDIRASYKKDTAFWMTYENKLTKYIALVNEITQACCLQKFKHCKLQCHRAKQNIFVCKYCKGGLTNNGK